MASGISDEEALLLLRGALAASDDESTQWPADNVKFARSMFTRARGAIPSPEQIAVEIGEDRVDQLLPLILEKRKWENALKGHRSPCHYCGGANELMKYDFALMRVESTKLKVGETMASAVVAAATIPFLGAGVLRLPSRSSLGAAIHLRLVVCNACRKKHGNLLGLFILNEERASKHPLWRTLQDYGFTKFLPKERMPDEFLYVRNDDL